MLWVNFLHFYQPYNQQEDILNRVVNECYIPLTEGLIKRKSTAKTLVNISGALLKLLHERGYNDILNNFKILYESGSIELTGSSMYHSFLPLIPKEETTRQIKLNEDALRHYISKDYEPCGFFSPEMAISDDVLDVVSSLKYKWIAAPNLSYGEKEPLPNKLYLDKNTDLTVFFRNKRVSSLILSATSRTAEDLYSEVTDINRDDIYVFTVMDAETFGHHRIGFEEMLFDMLDSDKFTTTLPRDLIKKNYKKEYVTLRPCTWTNQEQDFWLDRESNKPTTAKSFILWKDPENPIHKLQWDFVDYVSNLVNSYKNKTDSAWISAREKLDIAIASDQFWWASIKPWWSLEMVEQGAYLLKDVVITLNVGKEQELVAESYYREIIDHAFEWQRSGYIRNKHLENSSTYLKEPFNTRAPSEWYNQIILEFEDEMKKSAEKRDFEKAIKWRDAVIKLKRGTDIYDVLHVVDELWSARTIPSVKPFLEHNWEEFSTFAKDTFRDVPDKTAFENWKNRNSSNK